MLYDYKSEEVTQEVFVRCLCPIVDDLIDEYSTLRRYDNLSIYAPSYIVREILGRLFDEMDVLWVHEDSENVLLHNDDNEVVVTIGYDGMVFIEDAKVDGVIKSNEDSCLTYFYDGLSKKDLDILEENAESILLFGFEDDDCEGCKSEDENTELSIADDEPHYYINGKEVDEKTYLKEYGKIIEEMNAFERLFWNW